MSARFESGGAKERSSVRTLGEALSQLAARFPEVRDALASAEKALERRAELERQLAEAAASETDARRAVAQAEAGREQEAARRRQLEAELERLSETERAKRETLERREQELQAAREEGERSFRDAREAQGLLAVSHGEEQRSRAEADQRSEALEHAEAEFGDLRRRIVELEGDLRNERGRRAQERAERDRIRAEATRRESELGDAERKLAQARRQHASTTDQLARTQRSLADQLRGAGDSPVATERELPSGEPPEPPPGPRRGSGPKGLARRTVVPSRWTIAG